MVLFAGFDWRLPYLPLAALTGLCCMGFRRGAVVDKARRVVRRWTVFPIFSRSLPWSGQVTCVEVVLTGMHVKVHSGQAESYSKYAVDIVTSEGSVRVVAPHYRASRAQRQAYHLAQYLGVSVPHEVRNELRSGQRLPA